MKLISLFPTLVYEHQGTIDEIFLIQDEIKKKLPAIEATDTFCNPPGWNDGVQTNIKSRHNTIEDFELTNLKAFIEKHIKQYINLSQAWHPVPVALRHSWVNKTSHTQAQDWHQHQDSLISGSYYYQTNGEDGDFGIMNPVPWMQQEVFPFGNLVEKYTEIKPAVGKLLLFPGWLNHSVGKNTTDGTRISISFNFHRDFWKDNTQDRVLI
jgi:uncharacterized protein (TIGR02466 family)